MLKRDDYKAIKRMDRQQMSEYLQRLYQRGFDAGAKAQAEQPVKMPVERNTKE